MVFYFTFSTDGSLFLVAPYPMNLTGPPGMYMRLSAKKI